MTLRALVPVQDFTRAKSRLASALDDAARAALAKRLATHVIGTLRPHVHTLTVVSPSDEVCRFAEALGVSAVRDDASARGLAGVVDAAIGEHVPTLVVMSDLPVLCGEDVLALIAASRVADVVIGPDTAGLGTNALLLMRAMPTCFGHEDSAHRHRARAESLGLRTALVERHGIGSDVDRAEHLALTGLQFTNRT